MNKVIIDTDPGVDDALALAFALSSQLDVIGITTLYGNSSLADSTANALAIVDLLRRNVPVFSGASRPLRGVARRASSHGKKGLGGLVIDTMKTKEQATAQSFIVEELRKSDMPIDIIVIGPATNIARVVRDYPDVLVKIGQVIIMAGVINSDGNITKKAEFNAYNDPLALRLVLSSPLRTVLIPADVCRQVVFAADVFREINNKSMQESMLKLTNAYIAYYQQNNEFETFDGGVMYDLLTVAYMIDPSIFSVIPVGVTVNVEAGDEYGMTTLSSDDATSLVVRDVDAGRIKELFLGTLNGTI
jgi:inosine-uridine nucleoside N-ribohydrolase